MLFLAVVAAAGCGPAAPSSPEAPARQARAYPASVDLAMLRAGTDVAGSEVRVALRGVFVPPAGEDADFIGAGAGEGISFAYRSRSGGDPEGDIYFEWGLERSAHEEVSSGRAAEYWRAYAGVRRAVPWGRRTELFASVGAGYHEIAVSGGREMTGTGIYGGMGVEFLLARASSLLLDAKLHYFWGGGSAGGNGLSAALAAGVGLRF